MIWISVYSYLQLLDLSRNQLNGFDEIFVVKLQQIKDVRLENNPLICDRCRMGFLIDIARKVYRFQLISRSIYFLFTFLFLNELFNFELTLKLSIQFKVTVNILLFLQISWNGTQYLFAFYQNRYVVHLYPI